MFSQKVPLRAAETVRYAAGSVPPDCMEAVKRLQVGFRPVI